jgi:hypothetical protein
MARGGGPGVRLLRTEDPDPRWLVPDDTMAAFERVGALGGHVLTQLPAGPALRLRERIDAYREAWRRSGREGAGHVTLAVPARLAGNGTLDRLGALGVDEVAVASDSAPLADGAPAHRAAPSHLVPDTILEQGVTHVQCTPSMVRLLLAEPRGREALGSLRALILGGEVVTTDLATDLVGLLRTGRVVNYYGPTEATFYATTAEVTSELPLAPAGPVSVGRPFAGWTAHVLDARLQPVPPGIPGEVCVGGAWLARGYVGRPDETAARFVPDPWAERPGGRLYRTGDVGWWLPDGRLGFLGRVDRQVKLNGHRIELPEIEQVLCRHPRVRGASVVLDRSGPEPVLVAVVEGDPEEDDLRRHLRAALPGSMLPAWVVAVPALPLTATGKVDLKEVAALVSQRPRPLGRGPEQEDGRLGQRVAGVWRQVLRRDVEPQLDFFEGGGHSLLVLQVAATLSGELGVAVPPSLLFEAPRLGDFTARVSGLLP